MANSQDTSVLPNHRNGAPTVIISETDIFGNILFANDAFCEISGYSRNELIGAPHNIIRHPSMPRELFRQMWHTIQKGEIFRGIIMNKHKDGQHYWVNTTILPVFENSKIIRYMGGRHLIKDNELAERLFKTQATNSGWL